MNIKPALKMKNPNGSSKWNRRAPRDAGAIARSLTHRGLCVCVFFPTPLTPCCVSRRALQQLCCRPFEVADFDVRGKPNGLTHQIIPKDYREEKSNELKVKNQEDYK
jgi:hypothetical protein